MSEPTRLLVTGGRNYGDDPAERNNLFAVLDAIHVESPLAVLIHGGANGADFWAGQWAKSRGVPVIVEKADWALHGKAAGPIRNQWMLDQHKPTLAVAFPGGPGTGDMVRRIQAARVPLRDER